MNKVREFSAVVVITLFIAFLFFLQFPYFDAQKDREIKVKLPKSTIYYIRFDAVQFLKELSLVALFDSKDQDFFVRLKEKIDSQKDEERSPWMNMGVDNFQPIELIVCNIEKKTHVFLRFKVFDEEAFKKFGKENNKNVVILTEYGYLAVTNSAKEKWIESLVEEFEFRETNEINGELSIHEFDAGVHLSTYEINHEENLVNILSKQKNTPFSTCIIPDNKGVELCWSPSKPEKEILSTLNPSLVNFYSSIDYLSASYEGFTFIDNFRFPGIPKGTLIISFNQAQEMTKVLNYVKELFNFKDVNLESNKIIFSEDISMYCHKMSPKTYALSFNSSMPKIKEIQLPNKYFGGNITCLFSFENPGYYQYIIEAIPGLNLAKGICSDTKSISFNLKNDNKGNCMIKIDKPSGFYSGILKLVGIFI